MWYYEVSFNELNGYSPYTTEDGLYMGETSFFNKGLDPNGRAMIFVTEDGYCLTEDEVCKVMYAVGCFDSSEDLNLLTPKELEEILSYEIHGY